MPAITTLVTSNHHGLKTQSISISVDPNGPPNTITIMAEGPMPPATWIKPGEHLHLEAHVARCLVDATPGTYQIFWESTEDDVYTPEAAADSLMDTLHLEGNLMRVGCSTFWFHPHFRDALRSALNKLPHTPTHS